MLGVKETDKSAARALEDGAGEGDYCKYAKKQGSKADALGAGRFRNRGGQFESHNADCIASRAGL